MPVTILCYHSADPRWESPMAVRPGDLDDQLGWLARHRRVVPLDVATGMLDRAGRLPHGTAAVTFDDGFADFADQAVPLLRRHGVPATVFLVAQTLSDAGQAVDWVDTAPSWQLRTLTREQVLELQAGGVRFESHGWAHLDLTTLGMQQCVRDLHDSRELLEDLLGREVRQLAYPRGRHDATVREAAARAGYEHAFALPESAERPGPYAVPRVGVYRGNSLRTVRIKSSRTYLPLRSSPVARLLRRG